MPRKPLKGDRFTSDEAARLLQLLDEFHAFVGSVNIPDERVNLAKSTIALEPYSVFTFGSEDANPLEDVPLAIVKTPISQSHGYWFTNGSIEVNADTPFHCDSVTSDLTRLRVSGTIAIGEYGCPDDTGAVEKGPGFLQCLSSTVDGHALFISVPERIIMCKTDAEIPSGGSGMCTVWEDIGSGPEATTQKIEVNHDWVGSDEKISVDKRLYVHVTSFCKLRPTGGDCE